MLLEELESRLDAIYFINNKLGVGMKWGPPRKKVNFKPKTQTKPFYGSTRFLWNGTCKKRKKIENYLGLYIPNLNRHLVR